MSSKSNPYKRAGRNGSSGRHRTDGEDNTDNNNNIPQQPIVNQRRQRRLPVENNNNNNLGFDVGNIFPQELLLLNNNNNNIQQQQQQIQPQQPQLQQQQQQQPSNNDIRNALAVLRRLRETVNNNVNNSNINNDTSSSNNNNENANANAKAGDTNDDDNNNNDIDDDWLKELDGDYGNAYDNNETSNKAAEEDDDNENVNDDDDEEEEDDDTDDDEDDDDDDEDNPANDNNNNNNNNNIQRDVGDDEAEDAVPPNDPNDIDNNDDDENNDDNINNNHFDAGVAEVDDRSIKSTTADIVLFLTCSEEIAFFPNHPILRPGVCVQIGLGKACLLRSVFQRYVDFCNEQQEKVFNKQNKSRDITTTTSTDGKGINKHRKRKNNKNTTVASSNNGNGGKNVNNTSRGTTGSGVSGGVANAGGSTYPIVKVEHLEFLHCTVLSGDDTAENAALMKNDRLTVQYERSAERQRDASFHEKHRKSDKIYFEQLRSIVVPHFQIERPTTSASTSFLKPGVSTKVFVPATTDSADAVLVCEGRLHSSQVDEFLYQNGFGNISRSSSKENHITEEKSSTIKCDSYIISKRCRWLSHIIQQARVDAQLKKIQLQQQQQKEEEERQLKEQHLREQNQNDMVEDNADNGVVVEEDDDDPIDVSRQSVVTIPDIVDGQPIQQQQQQQHYDHGQLVVVDDVLSQQEQQIIVGNEVQAEAVGRHDQWISQGSNEDLDDYEMEVLNNNNNNSNNIVAAVNRNENNVPPELQGIVDDVVVVPIPAAQIVASDEEDLGNGRNLAMQRLVSGSGTGAGMKIDNSNSGAINKVIDIAANMQVSRNITESSSDEAVSDNDNSTLLIVPIKDHSPEAMMLLVEYCYTNRVVALGFEAFSKSCRTKPFSKSKRESATHAASNIATWPVSPFSSSKEMSTPAISFGVAVAGISLGEEAKMNRFSFMCEIAAAQLVTSIQVAIAALKICEEHNELYKNPLPRLREAAMYRIFMSRNSIDSAVFPALVTEDSNKLLVSPLLMGIVDVIEKSNKAHDKNETSPGTHHHSHSKANRRKSAWPWPTNYHHLQQQHHHSNDPTLDVNNRNGSSDDLQVFMSHIDLEEAAERDRERYKRRYEKLKQLSSIGLSSDNDPPTSPTKISNKRQCTKSSSSSSVTDAVSAQVPSSKVFSFGSRENTALTFGSAKDGSTNNNTGNNSSSHNNNNNNNRASFIAAIRSQTLLRMAGHNFPTQPYVYNSSFEVTVPPSRFAPAAPSPLRQSSSSIQYESLSPHNATAENTTTVAGSTGTGTTAAAAAAASNVAHAMNNNNNNSNRESRNKNSNSANNNNNNNSPYKRSNHRRKLP